MMKLKDRLRLILDEQHIRQKDLADAIKVSESYISNMLNGHRSNLSESLSLLIEQKYGYRSQWLLSGEGTPRLTQSCAHTPPPFTSTTTRNKLIARIEEMSEPELKVVSAFIDSLDNCRKMLQDLDA